MRPNHVRPLEREPSDESGISRALPRAAASPEGAAPYADLIGEFWERHAELLSPSESVSATHATMSKTELERELLALRKHVSKLSAELEHKRAELEALQALLPTVTHSGHPERTPATGALQPSAMIALTGVSVHVEDDGCRRTAPRSNLTLEVEFMDESGLYSGLTEDISTGGVFVATYRLLPIGTDVSLSLNLSNGTKLEVRGEVRWLRTATQGAIRPGMGIAFTELPANAGAMLGKVCEHRSPLYVEL